MSSAPYPNDDPRNEGRLADLVSAGMWTTSGLAGAAMFALPGSSHAHLAAGVAVAGLAVLWGLVSLALYLRRATMSIGTRAVVTAATAPLVAAAIWARGYSPGLVTALLVNLPFSLFLFRRALRASWVRPRDLAWLLVAALLVHGPGLVGLMVLAGWAVG